MNYLHYLLAAAALSATAAHAAPPIEYCAAVRNTQGVAVANKPVSFRLQVMDSPAGGKVLYGETHEAVTDQNGMARLMIGEGEPATGSFDALDWQLPRYLAVNVDVDGSGTYRLLGTMQLLGAPYSRQCATTTSLVRHDASGNAWELTVDNMGDLSWQRLKSSTPAYDQTKVPEELYFIGTFNSWAIAEAVPFTKLSSTTFAITRTLEPGEIFKFTYGNFWSNLDWSATECIIGTPCPMREFQDTPAFPGPKGTYTITVDFFDFTMTITPE